MRYIFLAIVGALFMACDSKSQNISKAESVSTNLEQLQTFINIENIPDSVKWIKRTKGKSSGGMVPGPLDYQLVGILYFSANKFEDVKKRLIDSENIHDKVYLDKSFVESWFPNNIKSKLYMEDGYCRILGPVYKPFIFSKPPFTDGLCFLTDDGEIFVLMYTK